MIVVHISRNRLILHLLLSTPRVKRPLKFPLQLPIADVLMTASFKHPLACFLLLLPAESVELSLTTQVFSNLTIPAACFLLTKGIFMASSCLLCEHAIPLLLLSETSPVLLYTFLPQPLSLNFDLRFLLLGSLYRSPFPFNSPRRHLFIVLLRGQHSGSFICNSLLCYLFFVPSLSV